MAAAAQSMPRASDLQGFKLLDAVMPLLRDLRQAGHAPGQHKSNRARRRSLHIDQYCGLVLLAMLNPAIDSMRALLKTSSLEKVQQAFGCRRVSLGSFSEAPTVFNPTLLEGVVAELGEQLACRLPDKRLKDPRVRGTLELVDGTLLKGLPKLVGSTHQDGIGGRLHTHFELGRGVPTAARLDGYRGKGTSEKRVLRRSLQAGRTYVLDRGYVSYELFNAVVEA